MRGLLIAAGIFLFLLIPLLLPLSVDFSGIDETVVSVRFGGIPVFRTDKKKDKPSAGKKKENRKSGTKKKTAKKKKSFSPKDHFSDLYGRQGITGTVGYVIDVLRLAIEKSGVLIRKFHFSKFRLCLSVASDDPAKTAIDYGTICAVVYPTLSFLFQKTECKAKQVDISADFIGNKTAFSISFSVRTTLFVLLITVLQSLKSYKGIKDVYFNE